MRHVPVPVPAVAGQRVFGPPRARLRLWLMSDLHIDKRPYALPTDVPTHDVLVAAGNLSNSLETSLRWLAAARDGCREPCPVVLVPGNAEFWDGVPRAEALRRGRALAASLGIHLLSDEVLRIEDAAGVGVHLIGATLWTDWAVHGRARASLARGYARHGHRDCRRIRLARSRHLPHDAAGAHARSRAFIEDCLNCVKVASEGFGLSPVTLVDDVRPGDRSVVVTHHGPHPLSISSASAPDVCDEWISAAQCSDLADLLQVWSAPTVWVHGQVDEPVDYTLGKTRVVANPRSQRFFDTAFDPTLIVEA